MAFLKPPIPTPYVRDLHHFQQRIVQQHSSYPQLHDKYLGHQPPVTKTKFNLRTWATLLHQRTKNMSRRQKGTLRCLDISRLEGFILVFLVPVAQVKTRTRVPIACNPCREKRTKCSAGLPHCKKCQMDT